VYNFIVANNEIACKSALEKAKKSREDNNVPPGQTAKETGTHAETPTHSKAHQEEPITAQSVSEEIGGEAKGIGV